jgi:hypothetical protein
MRVDGTTATLRLKDAGETKEMDFDLTTGWQVDRGTYTNGWRIWPQVAQKLIELYQLPEAERDERIHELREVKGFLPPEVSNVISPDNKGLPERQEALL